MKENEDRNKRKTVITRNMSMKKRVKSIGVKLCDDILEFLSIRLDSGEIAPIDVLFVITYLFTNANATSVISLFNLPNKEYTTKKVNKMIEDILINVKQYIDMKNGKQDEEEEKKQTEED